MSEPTHKTILVFGGSFDPPTRAHVELPEAARHALAESNPEIEVALLYIPAARSPHKPDQPTAPGAARLAMLRAATADNPNAHISSIELSRAENDPDSPSYTIDTLRQLTERYPDAQLRLLIGADQARSFHRWRDPREIIHIAPPLVMLRSPTTHDELLEAMAPHWSEHELHGDAQRGVGGVGGKWGGWGDAVIHVHQSGASSTEARALLSSGALDEQLLPLLPKPVLRIIRQRNLYSP